LSPGPDVSMDRLHARRDLAHFLETTRRGTDFKSVLQDMDNFQAKAFDLLTSQATRKAFHLDQEPAAIRDSYGRYISVQSVLCARRLIEAGTRVACISWAP